MASSSYDPDEAAFKRIADGYLFQSSSPWIVGPPRRYVVNEAQKAAIVSRMRRTQRSYSIPMALGALALVALVVVLPHYGVMAGAAQLYALGLAFGIFVVIHAYRMLRLRPLLVGLPRSDTRISFQELTSLYAQHLSSRLLGFLTVGSAVGFVAKCGLGFASGRIVNEPFDLVTVAISAMMAVYFGYCLFLKMQFGRRALSSADHPSLFPLREVSAK